MVKLIDISQLNLFNQIVAWEMAEAFDLLIETTTQSLRQTGKNGYFTCCLVKLSNETFQRV